MYVYHHLYFIEYSKIIIIIIIYFQNSKHTFNVFYWMELRSFMRNVSDLSMV